MEALETIERRQSIRMFNSNPVPREDIASVISAGIAAPSKGNCQIWEFIGVTGEKKKAMDTMLLKLLKTDLIPSMKLSDSNDITPNEALKKAERRSSHNKQEISRIVSPMGLSFEKFMLEGTFTFFNAPVAILVFVDEVFSKDLPQILSVGAAVQNLLLAATDMGLGACWIGGVWRYTKDIRMLLEIPDNKRLLSSVALGYPDLKSPINKYRSPRDDISEFVRWIGFDEK
jgi:nitroreductase